MEKIPFHFIKVPTGMEQYFLFHTNFTPNQYQQYILIMEKGHIE